MTGTSLRVSTLTLDDAQVQAGFAALERLLADLSPIMDEIGGAMESNVALRFQSGKGPGGQTWPPSRRAREEGGQTLIDTGRLRSSITYIHGADFAEVGTNTVYAAIHQFGGDITRYAQSRQLYFKRDADGLVGNRFVRKEDSDFAQWATWGDTTITMPARPFLGWDDDDQAEVMAIFERALGEAIQ